MKLTLLSDTHSKHKWIPTEHLSGGDILIHAGDISSMGYEREVYDFLKWFNSIPGYTHKIFIAGNHDWLFERNRDVADSLVRKFTDITYLQDSYVMVEGLKIYGAPWQPEFYNWAFNLPRNGEELQHVWDKIPEDTDILVTHGPAHGYVDRVIGRYEHLGCELLAERIKEVKPLIHVSGHIHSGNGVSDDGTTTYLNASVLNERYEYEYRPYNILLEARKTSILY